MDKMEPVPGAFDKPVDLNRALDYDAKCRCYTQRRPVPQSNVCRRKNELPLKQKTRKQQEGWLQFVSGETRS